GEINPVAPLLGFVGLKLEQSQRESMKRRVAERERDERETESFSSTCDVQVLRSISSWSGSLSRETSIYSAYLDVIDESEKFIYIENQFFIGSLAGGDCKNLVAKAILFRIRKAIERREKFRVIILLPHYPTGDL